MTLYTLQRVQQICHGAGREHDSVVGERALREKHLVCCLGFVGLELAEVGLGNQLINDRLGEIFAGEMLFDTVVRDVGNRADEGRGSKSDITEMLAIGGWAGRSNALLYITSRPRFERWSVVEPMRYYSIRRPKVVGG